MVFRLTNDCTYDSYRTSRTKASPTSTPTGINELEGSVLLEADDYRRISNDVKSLKTALLKLKRELQADVSKRLFWRYIVQETLCPSPEHVLLIGTITV